MRPGYKRLAGLLVFVVWFWWAHDWAHNLAVVSPIHWPLLLPKLVLEGVPATIGITMAVMLFLNSSRAKPVAALLCLSTIQSAALAAATPEIGQRHEETVMRARETWKAPPVAKDPGPVSPSLSVPLAADDHVW